MSFLESSAHNTPSHWFFWIYLYLEKNVNVLLNFKIIPSHFCTDMVAIINYHQGTKTYENFRSFWKLRYTAWLSGCNFMLVWILHDWGVQFGKGAIFWFPVQHMKTMVFQKGPATRNFPSLGLGFTSNYFFCWIMDCVLLRSSKFTIFRAWIVRVSVLKWKDGNSFLCEF